MSFHVFFCKHWSFIWKWNISQKRMRAAVTRHATCSLTKNFFSIKILPHQSAMELELIFFYHGYTISIKQRKKNKNRQDKRTPWISLKQYAESPFSFLFNSGNDQALLNCCAVDLRVFCNLLHLFKPIYNRYTVNKNTGRIGPVVLTKHGEPKGRRRELDAIDCLVLVLYWFQTWGSLAWAMSLAFGLTAPPMYKWLRFSQRILLFVLQKNPLAKVCQPTSEQIEEYIKGWNYLFNNHKITLFKLGTTMDESLQHLWIVRLSLPLTVSSRYALSIVLEHGTITRLESMVCTRRWRKYTTNTTLKLCEERRRACSYCT